MKKIRRKKADAIELEECDKENAEVLAGFMSEFEQVLEYRTEIEQILEDDDMEKIIKLSVGSN